MAALNLHQLAPTRVGAFIHDTNDTESTSWPYQQYDALLAAKKDPNGVIMLGVVLRPLKHLPDPF